MSRRRERPTAGYLFRRLFCGCCKRERVIVRSIDLSHSLLNEVPPEVYMCERTLEHLCLDSNHVVELPRQLFNCDELRSLSVSDNELHFIPPAISFLQNLQTLDLSKNAVTTLPDTIRQCSSLTYLDVSINPLEKLPEGLVNIVSLKELYLTDVFLEFLPANFGKLINLHILELRDNSLSTLPKTMNRLVHLTRLDIGYNEFRELPEVVSSLQNLIELWIDGNHIKKLNNSIGQLRKMIHFDASHNNMEILPRDVGYWTRVQEFNVSNNELINVPSTIGNLKNLIGLRLEENSLRVLPDTLGKLTNLEELTLTHNYLTNLPCSIGLLRKLRMLTVDKNYISELPPELGSCTSLSILSLRGNRLSEIPAEIGHLSNLRVLNLVDNTMRFLPISILKLEKLGALWLSNNQSQPLMPLQQELNHETMTNVLTCFMLPQQSAQPEPGPSRQPDDTPRVAPRHIYFAPNIGAPPEQPRRLTRAPTPYPKELRALAKHAKHVQKTLSVSHHRPSETVAHQVQGPLEIKEATVKVKPGSSTTSSDPTPLSPESMISPMVLVHRVDTEPTPDSSVSSLPVAYESSPIIREAKNIRTDSQAGPSVHSPTPQVPSATPATSKEAKVPPPYHIAAAYSVKAQFFHPTESALPESASTSHSAYSPSFSIGDHSDQQRRDTHRGISPSLSAGERSDQQSVRAPYTGRSSYPSSKHTGSRTSPLSSHRVLRRSTVSPALTSDDSSEQPSPFVRTSVLDPGRYALGRSSSQPNQSVAEQSDPRSTRSLSIFTTVTHYSSSEGRGTASPAPEAVDGAARSPDEPAMRSLSPYKIRTPSHTARSVQTDSTPSESEVGSGVAVAGSSDPDNVVSSVSLSPGEIRLPSSDPSSGEIRGQRSSNGLDIYQSCRVQRSTHSTYTSTSTDNTSGPYTQSGGDSNQEEFVSISAAPSVSGASSQVSSTPATSYFEPSESSSEPTSRSNFQLLTPPFPTSSTHLLTTIREHSGSASQIDSDPIARSVECDMGSSNTLSNRSSTGFILRSPRLHIRSRNISEQSSQTSIGSSAHAFSLDAPRSTHSHSLSGFALRTPRLLLPESGSSSREALNISDRSGQQSSVGGSEHMIDPADYSLPQSTHSQPSLSLHQTLSGHSMTRSAHSMLSGPLFQLGESTVPTTPHMILSARPTQSSTSILSLTPSGQSMLSDDSSHPAYPTPSPNLPQALSTRSTQTLTPSAQSPYVGLSARSAQSMHSGQSLHSNQSAHLLLAYAAHSPYSGQSVYSVPSPHSAYSIQTPPSALSVYSPQSLHSTHSVQTARTVQSTDTVDPVAVEPSESQRTHNLNETFTRTLHPCAVLDNDNIEKGDHENNFDPEDNKPRFFVQDKPAPGQNIVAPTPKRPNAGDKSTRIPYLTSPTMPRSTAFASPQASTSQFVSVVTSPRSCRRDMSVREVKSDTSIASTGAGVKKTKIPGPNSKPVSPESSRGKRWVFGQHKNATVMVVLIQKNPDLGFSITEVPDKGIFIDDVKTQELLSVGDKILEVEGIDVTVLHKEEVMEILLAAGKNISMMISHI